jgi:hypothetical protein
MSAEEISLAYLMTNKNIHIKKEKINKKDKKFYKRRIYDLTKQLLNGEKPNIFHDIIMTFDIYMKQCIDYFKSLDKTDIIQEGYQEYQDYQNFQDQINIDSSNIEINESNHLLMRQIKVKSTLDNFVKRASKPKEILPIQKEINLKDPILKNKGIRKKKNIDNNYETNKEKTEK